MLLKCKMCGGDLDVEEGATLSRCPYCGTNQTISPVSSVNASKIVPGNEPALLADIAHAMVLRGNLALEDGEFELADYYFERSLDSNPCSGRAYLGKFLASKKAPSLATLKDKIIDYDANRNFQRAVEFSDQELASELSEAIASNTSNIDRARKAAAEEKAALEEKQAKFNNAKHEAFRILLNSTSPNTLEARRLFDGVEDICPEQYARLDIDNLVKIVRDVSDVLASRTIFSEAELLKHLNITDADRQNVSIILSELVSDGLIEATREQGAIKYGLPGAKEEDDERRKKQLFSKMLLVLKERYYRDACASIEADVQAELSPLSRAIASKYESDIEAARCDLGNAESAAMREKVRLQMEISKLKAQRNSLGLFCEQRKAAIDEEIASADIQLGALSSPEQIRAAIMPHIEGLIAQRDEEIQATEADVRARHPFPNKKSFFAEMSRKCNPE